MTDLVERRGLAASEAEGSSWQSHDLRQSYKTLIAPVLPDRRKLFIKSYGCQMNVYDAQRMTDLLAPEGFDETAVIEEADLVILNTCHIRERAAEKVFSELGKIRELKQERKAGGLDDTSCRGRVRRSGRKRRNFTAREGGRSRRRAAKLSPPARSSSPGPTSTTVSSIPSLNSTANSLACPRRRRRRPGPAASRLPHDPRGLR